MSEILPYYIYCCLAIVYFVFGGLVIIKILIETSFGERGMLILPNRLGWLYLLIFFPVAFIAAVSAFVVGVAIKLLRLELTKNWSE